MHQRGGATLHEGLGPDSVGFRQELDPIVILIGVRHDNSSFAMTTNAGVH